MKRTDVPSAQYAELAEVDLQVTSVSAFKTRWMSTAKVDVDPSFVKLRQVRCGSRKPAPEEEAAAVELDDPSLTLAAAGIADTAWLLVDIVQLARLVAEREEEAERQRAERRARRGAQPFSSSTS